MNHCGRSIVRSNQNLKSIQERAIDQGECDQGYFTSEGEVTNLRGEVMASPGGDLMTVRGKVPQLDKETMKETTW